MVHPFMKGERKQRFTFKRSVPHKEDDKERFSRANYMCVNICMCVYVLYVIMYLYLYHLQRTTQEKGYVT